ncbi:hypothetical protein AAHB65_30225 [Bacillus toyonensis]
MPETLELILFILIAISAVGYLIKEIQKPKKRTLGISIRIFSFFLVNMENIDYHNLIYIIPLLSINLTIQSIL